MAASRGGFAAIDCGTNSTRVLIVDESGEPIERRIEITRLGQDVDRSGRLSTEAIDRTVATLEDYRAAIDRYPVSDIGVTATSAARDATNRGEFFDAAEAVLGVRPVVLSGVEEGRLSFVGATAELDSDLGPFLVVDIGGGSTEFVLGAGGGADIDGALSLDVGSVRLTERYIEHDPPLPEELAACLSVMEAHLDEVKRGIPDVADAATLVGLAGTISAAAAVEIGLADYDRDRLHHFRLTQEAAEDVFRTLATESRDERLGNPGLPEGRADIIVGGLCVLVSVFRRMGFAEMIVSESDILDGMIDAMRGGGTVAGR